MNNTFRKWAFGLVLAFWSFSVLSFAQSTTGTVSGTVMDEQKGVIPGASVTVKSLDTNVARTALSDQGGRFRFPGLPVGPYELTIEMSGFARYVRSPINLLLNQDAVLEVALKLASVAQTITITEDAPLLNTTNAEVGVRFDTRRISELPLSTDRNVFNIALSAAGVSQVAPGQSEFASGTNFSVNGMRLRSNNFMIDGQDTNDPSVTGRTQPLNNPDIVQEFRLITNQFAAEYGRAAGSVVNIVTKSGTNKFHGSLFWFHNDNNLNSRSNQDQAPVRQPDGTVKPKFKDAPFRLENQVGGTFSGPILRDKTFFLGSLQRWTDRRLGSGTTIRGVPTEEGRQILQRIAGNKPQVQALLKFLPAAQAPIPGGVIVDGNTIPVGTLSGSTSLQFNGWQWSTHIDHNFTPNHVLRTRYLFSDSESSGSGQATPPGLTIVNPARQQLASASLTSTLSPRMLNELRVGWQRLGTITTASDPASETIPSIEIPELGLTGFNAAASRTAIGLAVNLPQFRFNNTYQIQDSLSYTRGSHSLKGGVDMRRVDVKSFFFPTIRGLLRYPTLQSFVDDVAEAANINKPLPGGDTIQYYKWWDLYFFAQDEWKVRRNLTLTYGLRYELPGNAIDSLLPSNERIIRAAGNDRRFALSPVPKRDTNNVQPRFGFNWNPRTDNGGPLGWLTGGDKLVLRGGYSRTNDYAFLNIALNVASSFPFVAAINSPGLPNAFTTLPGLVPTGLNPNELTRTVVAEDFRSPYADQYSLEVQREVLQGLVMRVGYVATKGSALFQTIDANPNISGPDGPIRRLDSNRGVIRLRANASSSIYHSMQVSVDRRLSRGFSAGAHYTWSVYIDDASEIFNPSVSGEVAVSQDFFNRRADRGRSTYDRPHRFTTNFVWEFPFYRNQAGALGRLLGGWQVNALWTIQSGPPFTVLNGSDPARVVAGIDGLVGNSIRADLNTTTPIRGMSVEELVRNGGAGFFRRLPNRGEPGFGQRVGNLGRNVIRGDNFANLDFGIFKNTRLTETHTLQFRCEMYNSTNSRNFGIPESRIISGAFLDQWATNGGNRRITLGLRYIF
ncbi:MAG: TonB-dependent receptor [Acidobacteria bacterium]|nr:TonB-dependent receptor [Acidobacteriota bacterium]MBI3658463.1 TonB-dependent receptor [Acidobacteriota bacterium]